MWQNICFDVSRNWTLIKKNWFSIPLHQKISQDICTYLVHPFLRLIRLSFDLLQWFGASTSDWETERLNCPWDVLWDLAVYLTLIQQFGLNPTNPSTKRYLNMSLGHWGFGTWNLLSKDQSDRLQMLCLGSTVFWLCALLDYNLMLLFALGFLSAKKEITLLRVIPTLAFQVIYSDIYFDILSNILSDIYSDILSGISSSILSGMYFGVLFGIYSGILCGILSRIYFGILCGIYSGSLSGIYSGSFSGIYSGIPSGHWGPAVPTELGRSQVEVQRCPLGSKGPWLRSSGARCAQNLAVEVQPCPLRSEAGSWGPAVPTAHGSWRRNWQRVGKAEVDVEVEAEVVEEKESNNPHLAGGEQILDLVIWGSFRPLTPQAKQPHPLQEWRGKSRWTHPGPEEDRGNQHPGYAGGVQEHDHGFGVALRLGGWLIFSTHCIIILPYFWLNPGKET